MIPEIVELDGRSGELVSALGFLVFFYRHLLGMSAYLKIEVII